MWLVFQRKPNPFSAQHMILCINVKSTGIIGDLEGFSDLFKAGFLKPNTPYRPQFVFVCA